MVSTLDVVLVLVCEVLLDRKVMDAGVHEQVDTDDLIEGFHSEAIDTLENREEEVAEHHRPDCADGSSKDLDFELPEAPTVDVAQVQVEDADSKAAPVTTEAMDLRSLYGVIDLHFLQDFVRDQVDDASDHTNNSRSPHLNVVARSSDSDKAGEDCVHESHRIVEVLSVLDLVSGHLQE